MWDEFLEDIIDNDNHSYLNKKHQHNQTESAEQCVYKPLMPLFQQPERFLPLTFPFPDDIKRLLSRNYMGISENRCEGQNMQARRFPEMVRTVYFRSNEFSDVP